MRPSSKKRLILHIGSHKTATTHIQGTLACNAMALSRMSILYPEAGQIYDAHFKLGWTLKAPQHQQTPLSDVPEWAALIKEIQASDAQMAIVSSEEFGTEVDPARLVPLTEYFDVTIVSYLRSPDSYMQSFYNQFVKDLETRETRTINTYIAENNLGFLNTRRILEPWLNVFGAQAIKLRLFHQAVKAEGGIVRDFFSAIGVGDLPELNTPAKEVLHKVSLPPDMLEYLRFANPWVQPDVSRHHKFVVKLVDISRKHPQALSRTSAGILSLAARRSLRTRFAGQNAWAARTFLQTDKTPFPPADTPPPPADFSTRPTEADARILGTVAGFLHNFL